VFTPISEKHPTAAMNPLVSAFMAVAFAQWLAKDIDRVFMHCVSFKNGPLSILKLIISHQLTELPDGTETVYSFWNGMPHPIQVQIFKLLASCRTVSKLAVFRNDEL
jgi:hypothetical protein